MIRILIVEDDIPTARAREMDIRDEFSALGAQLQIELAATVDEASQAIEQAYAMKHPFQAIILDFKLPRHHAVENPEVDESLCELVHRKMREATIIHCTSHVGDPDIEKHNHDRHQENAGVKACWLDKEDVHCPEKILANLRPLIYGQPIAWRLAYLLDQQPPPHKGVRYGSTAYELAMLCHEVGEYWDHLDAGLREEVARHLDVHHDGQKWRAELKR